MNQKSTQKIQDITWQLTRFLCFLFNSNDVLQKLKLDSEIDDRREGANYNLDLHLIWKCLKDEVFPGRASGILPFSSAGLHPFLTELSPLDSDDPFRRRSLCPANLRRQLLFESSNSVSSWNLATTMAD